MIQKAFTLIEILVVVTIIGLISTASTFYFIKYLDGKSIESDVELFDLEIESLDDALATRKINAYEISFTPGKWYTYNVNAYPGERSFITTSDFDTWVFTFDTDLSYSTSWSLKIYEWIKVKESILLDSQDTYQARFTNAQMYTTESYFSWSLANSIGVHYFSPDNVEDNLEKHLILESINTQQDGSGTNYLSLNVRNINGRKTLSSGAVQLTEVYLRFKKGSDEYVYHLQK